MVKKIFNTRNLACIESHEKWEEKDLVYDGNGLFTKQSDLSIKDKFTKEQLQNGGYHGRKYLVIDNKVYHKPFVKLCFIGGIIEFIEFDSDEDVYKNVYKLVDECIVKRIELNSDNSFTIIRNGLFKRLYKKFIKKHE